MWVDIQLTEVENLYRHFENDLVYKIPPEDIIFSDFLPTLSLPRTIGYDEFTRDNSETSDFKKNNSAISVGIRESSSYWTERNIRKTYRRLHVAVQWYLSNGHVELEKEIESDVGTLSHDELMELLKDKFVFISGSVSVKHHTLNEQGKDKHIIRIEANSDSLVYVGYVDIVLNLKPKELPPFILNGFSPNPTHDFIVPINPVILNGFKKPES